MFGKLSVLFCRIIPAYAGQIYYVFIFYAFNEDHPRIRGTNSGIPQRTISETGSSPHTRDKFLIGRLVRDPERIIPAYAGQIPSVMLVGILS